MALCEKCERGFITVQHFKNYLDVTLTEQISFCSNALCNVKDRILIPSNCIMVTQKIRGVKK